MNISQKFIEIANGLVSNNVGKSTETAKAINGENFIKFSAYFKTEQEIVEIWRKWLKAYCGILGTSINK